MKYFKGDLVHILGHTYNDVLLLMHTNNIIISEFSMRRKLRIDDKISYFHPCWSSSPLHTYICCICRLVCDTDTCGLP